MIDDKIKYNYSSKLLIPVLTRYFESGNITEFIETISELLGNPCAVVDSTNKIVANSDVSDIEDEQWLSSIQCGFYNDELISKIILTDRETDLNIMTNKPYFRENKNSKYKRIVSHLYRDDNIFGSVVVLLVNKDTQNCEEVLPFISELVLKMLNIANEDLPVNELNEDYANLVFANMLKGNMEKDMSFMNIVETQLGNAKYYQLLTVPIHQVNQIAVHNLKTNFENVFENSRIIYFEKNLQILRSSDRIFVNDKYTLKQLDGLLKSLSSLICISEVFTNIIQTSLYYKKNLQGIRVSEMLNENKSIIYYEDYLLLDAVLRATNNNVNDLEEYVSRKVNMIRKYDIEHGTTLFETLYEFLRSKESFSTASKNLHFHRNTVLYRINQIKSLFDINLDEFEEYSTTLFSCMIAKCLDSIKNER